MFIIRNAANSDLEDLFTLSQKANLLNLPSDREKLRELISKSVKSFKSPSQNLDENYYLFCLEDKKSQKIVGVSMIHGKHGTPNRPHYYLTVGTEVKQSKTLKTKIINHTLKLGIEPNGYTEIGGLILDPSYRGFPQKLGKQLSMSRFLYIVQHRHLFTEQIHSELLPPFDKNGKSLLWEGLGRKFLNMDYWEADLLSQKDRSFIHDLFPSATIYQNLLPPSALQVIGEVGDSTKPVKKMLESIGFEYKSEVDPFDGGPHYRAKLVDLKPFKEFIEIKGNLLKNQLEEKNDLLFLSDTSSFTENSNYHFCANLISKLEVNKIKEDLNYKGFFI